MIQLDVHSTMWNKKNGRAYTVLSRNVLDTTNANVNPAEEMVLYTDGSQLFVRNEKEFNEKFSSQPPSKES